MADNVSKNDTVIETAMETKVQYQQFRDFEIQVSAEVNFYQKMRYFLNYQKHSNSHYRYV